MKTKTLYEINKEKIERKLEIENPHIYKIIDELNLRIENIFNNMGNNTRQSYPKSEVTYTQMLNLLEEVKNNLYIKNDYSVILNTILFSENLMDKFILSYPRLKEEYKADIFKKIKKGNYTFGKKLGYLEKVNDEITNNDLEIFINFLKVFGVIRNKFFFHPNLYENSMSLLFKQGYKKNLFEHFRNSRILKKYNFKKLKNYPTYINIINNGVNHYNQLTIENIFQPILGKLEILIKSLEGEKTIECFNLKKLKVNIQNKIDYINRNPSTIYIISSCRSLVEKGLFNVSVIFCCMFLMYLGRRDLNFGINYYKFNESLI